MKNNLNREQYLNNIKLIHKMNNKVIKKRLKLVNRLKINYLISEKKI